MFIELHHGKSGEPALVNVAFIHRIFKDDEGRCKIFFEDDSEIRVKESYEFIASHLENAGCLVAYGAYVIGKQYNT